jgi:hypothetical protein
VRGDTCRCVTAWEWNCSCLGGSALGVDRWVGRSSLAFCRCDFVLLAQRPPVRPDVCLVGVGWSDLACFLLPVPLRYRVVDWTPSRMANSSNTHSVDFLVSSPETLRSDFLKACRL